MLGARLTSAGRPSTRRPVQLESGRSSGVEHNLAKVGVEGSNPFARSKFLHRCARARRFKSLRPFHCILR